jgi:hypothetical protein
VNSFKFERFNKYNNSTFWKIFFFLNQKAADFILFKQEVKFMNTKAHLNYEPLKKIVSIRASIKLVFSEFQKS